MPVPERVAVRRMGIRANDELGRLHVALGHDRMADPFGAFAVGEQPVMAQPILFTEPLLHLTHGLRHVEQPERATFGRHAAMDERQMIRKADDAFRVVQFNPVTALPAQEAD